MFVNRTTKIEKDGGDYIILRDWGARDNLVVWGQAQTFEEAMRIVRRDPNGLCLVRLVHYLRPPEAEFVPVDEEKA